METLLILAAIAACAVAGLVVVALNARSRREPLRMDSEHHVEDEALLLAEIGPSESPIDRSDAVLDLEPIRLPAPEPADRLAGPDTAKDHPR